MLLGWGQKGMEDCRVYVRNLRKYKREVWKETFGFSGIQTRKLGNIVAVLLPTELWRQNW